MRRSIIRLGIASMTWLVLFGVSRPAAAAPEGTVTWGVHITLASRWLDPAETEGIITPFMFLYALHDAVVKPMPAGWNTPSLAESWSQSKDGLTYELVLRKGVKFHNGDPVTAEDVKFSYERYRGAGVKLLKDRVKEVQIVDPGRIRFVLKEPNAWFLDLLASVVAFYSVRKAEEPPDPSHPYGHEKVENLTAALEDDNPDVFLTAISDSRKITRHRLHRQVHWPRPRKPL